MATLEAITRGAAVKGILPDGLVTISDVRWIGTVAIEVTYKDSAGRLGNELLYRDREPTLEIVEAGRPWSFDGDSALFRLLSEANRIRLAYLFDPLLAVHTSLVEPLPHQITAVYSEMLSRQPLRFLLADDPGAGKTIMTGLFISELIARGDLQRCLIVCPGNLVEQWQDELDRKFHLPFEIMTNDALEAARTGNWFNEVSLAICRLDKLSRNEDAQAKLQQTDWDLIVCDEAHKLSATYFGNEVKYTKRYRLGQLLSTLTRHFLLLTATPHNGKEADFQLFMALLDGDRFEGKFRDGVHVSDAGDMMRRLVKEQLLKFDGTPLFPERRAYTVNYALSDGEAELYKEVTDYVREEFNRAEALENEGRKGTVGFALTILQRRLASSPEAIYQSLKRRRERLEKRLREEQLLKRGAEVGLDLNAGLPALSADDIEDLDDAPDAELEDTEERVVDQASAARTIAELRAEIDQLTGSGANRASRPAIRHRPQMGRAFAAAAEQHRDVRRRRASPQTRHLHGAPRHPELPHREDSGTDRATGGRRHHSRRRRPRGTAQGRGIVQARQGSRNPGRDRRRRGRHQPATCPPDGELRSALESQPPGTAIRPHSPHRPDRSLPPVEPRRQGYPRRRGLSPAARKARRGAKGPGRPGVRRARPTDLRGPAASRTAARSHPLRRQARSQGPAVPGRRSRRSTASTCANWSRGGR